MGLMADIDRYIDQLIEADEAARKRAQERCRHSWSPWRNIRDAKGQFGTIRRCKLCKYIDVVDEER